MFTTDAKEIVKHKHQTTVQTFDVPTPEGDQNQSFEMVDTPSRSTSTIQSLVSISIAADNMLIRFDHWEDGYDSDVTIPTPVMMKSGVAMTSLKLVMPLSYKKP